ncbi:MAG: hypothetical protein U9O56_06655 [Campylobacterota bacterium]|nr:hypothetical protein [Campylobacterota bacterium]
MNIIKLFIAFSIFFNISYAVVMQEGNLYKEKQELMAVKDELNEFYESKELEYQKRKAELENIHKKIKDDEENIIKTRDENQKILDEINRVITSKAMLMYDKMKVGVVVNVFKEMLKNDEIDEVFDILVRLKNKRAMVILKKLDTKVATELMKKMKHYKAENNIKKEK